MSKEQISIDILINDDFYEEVMKEAGYDGYNDWLRARHDHLCNISIGYVYVLFSKYRTLSFI